MAEWNDLKWDTYKNSEDPVKRYKSNGEPFTGTIRINHPKYSEDILIISFVNGKEHGPFQIQHEYDGKEPFLSHPQNNEDSYFLTEGAFDKGVINGAVNIYYDNGKTLWCRGYPTISRMARPNEDNEMEDCYEFIYNDLTEYFNQDGTLDLTTYTPHEDPLITYFKLYYPNGNLKKYYKEKLKEKDGIEYEYYENGVLKKECKYDNGIPNGQCREYYKSNSIKSYGFFKYGFKDGKWIYYYENGIKEKEEIYDTPDIYIGTRTSTRPWGAERYRLNSDGVKHGEWKYYDIKGRIKRIEKYENNYQHGITIVYDKNGAEKRYKYRNGLFLGKESKIERFFKELWEY